MAVLHARHADLHGRYTRVTYGQIYCHKNLCVHSLSPCTLSLLEDEYFGSLGHHLRGGREPPHAAADNDGIVFDVRGGVSGQRGDDRFWRVGGSFGDRPTLDATTPALVSAIRDQGSEALRSNEFHVNLEQP